MANLGDLNLPTIKGLADGTVPAAELERRLNDNFAALRDSLKTLEADKRIYRIAWYFKGTVPAAGTAIGGMKSLGHDAIIQRASISASQRGSAGTNTFDIRRNRPVGSTVVAHRGNTQGVSIFTSPGQYLRIIGATTTTQNAQYSQDKFSITDLLADDFLSLHSITTPSVTRPKDVTVELFLEIS